MNLPCNVILDLIPLVKDNVASEETNKLVKNHIQSCENCKEILNSFSLENQKEKEINDKKIIKKIKKHSFIIGTSLLILGVTISSLFTFSFLVFYNFYIIPIIGIICYSFFKNKSIYFSYGLLVISYVMILIQSLIDIEKFSYEIFIVPIPYCLIYIILFFAGVLISLLIHYAFKKVGNKND